MAKRHEEEKHENQERWLLTYADLITLLMIFFVVLYALSKVDADKFKALSQTLAMVFGGGRRLTGGDEGGGKPTAIPQPATTDLQGLLVEANAFLQQQQMTGSSDVAQREGNVVISLSDLTLFEPGRAELRPDAMEKLKDIADVLTSGPYRIRVEGHTDNQPIRNGQYSSNWQLSAMRAANIVEELVREGKVPENRISAVGMGPSKPVSDNATAQGRARNRRVSIVIEPLPD
jgi:chemotaxis protein MotB